MFEKSTDSPTVERTMIDDQDDPKVCFPCHFQKLLFTITFPSILSPLNKVLDHQDLSYEVSESLIEV